MIRQLFPNQAGYFHNGQARAIRPKERQRVESDGGFKIVLREFKTAAQYGEKSFETSAEPTTVIRQYIEVMQPQKYLLGSKDNYNLGRCQNQWNGSTAYPDRYI